MKKTGIIALVFLLIGFGIGYLVFQVTGNNDSNLSVSPTGNNDPNLSASPSSIVSPVPSEIVNPPQTGGETNLVNVAMTAVELIKSGNYDKLSKMAHPEDGVYFTPYSNVDLTANMHFTAEQLSNFATDETAYLWGYTDGEGAPINLTPKQFFEKYVFNQDYTTAPVIGRNCIIKYGNSIENVQMAFPDCQFIEFHFPGFDEQCGVMDWCTLRIVFREYEGAFKIVAIIHAQWTI